MKNCKIVTEKRTCEPNDTTTINLNVDGKFYRNLWTLKDSMITPEVLSALRNAVDVGITLARTEAASAVNNLYVERG